MVQIEAVLNYMGAEGNIKKGDRVTVDERRARFLIEHGLGRVYRAPGPAETKPAEPAEKKFSGAATTGRSTGSQSSAAPGKDAQSLSSPAGPALRKSRRKRSVMAALFGPSESTTPT